MALDSEGSGYGVIGAIPRENAELTHVGIGTPMGELLRRYWQPVALSEELKDLPKRLRILGEDLVAFRDKRGRPGLLDAHCCHRGTSLEYARIEDNGLRCCYHGWLYDTEGHCLEQPGEPAQSSFRRKVRQPWYPVQELGGLLFAYMGPLEKKPELPFYDIFDQKSVVLHAYRNNSRGIIAECNWLQIQENAVDPIHTFFLHSYNSGLQFTDAYNVLPELDFQETDESIRYYREAALPNGNRFIRVQELFLPNVRSAAPPMVKGDRPIREPGMFIGWWVPVDNTHTVGFHIEILPIIEGKPCPSVIAAAPPGVSTTSMPARTSYEDTQRNPDDMEAQVSQRPIAIHALEHLGKTDAGIIKWRRMLKRAIEAMERGEDPPGLIREKAKRTVRVSARNEIIATDTSSRHRQASKS